MTTGVGCAKRCGGIVARKGDTCSDCNIEAISNPLWRSIRMSIHKAVSGSSRPDTDRRNGIEWHNGSHAGAGAMFLRCNDAATDAEASALDRAASGAEAPVPALAERAGTPGGRPEPAVGYGTSPAIKRAGPETPDWWTRATPEQRQAWKRVDAGLAQQLRYDRPYTHGPHVGTCPGTASSGRGRGLTASTVHGGDCCKAWDEAREQAVADGMAVPNDADGAVVAADVARWEAAQVARAETRAAGLDREAAG